MPLLKLEKDDPEKELHFSIYCSLKVPPAKRLQEWLEWNLIMLDFMDRQSHATHKSPQIVKRP